MKMSTLLRPVAGACAALLVSATGQVSHADETEWSGFVEQVTHYRKDSGLAKFRMVVKDLNATTYKYICCNGECPNPPSTAPKVGKSGWMQMLIAPQLDPYDMKDLTAAHPDIVTELRALLPPAYAAGCAKIDAEG